MEILKELDYEFDADQPKTRQGNIVIPDPPEPPSLKDLWEGDLPDMEDIWIPHGRTKEQTNEMLTRWNSKAPVKCHRKFIGGVFSKLANRYKWSSWQLFWARVITFGVMVGGMGTLIPLYLLSVFLMPDD